MANALHRNLEFTIEDEKESSILFQDILIQRRRDNTLRSGLYTKPTDTGLMMDYHSLAPVKYKRNVVEGTVQRMNQATCEWDEFTAGIENNEKTFEKNRYPHQFYSQIVRNTLSKIVQKETQLNKNATEKSDPLTTRPILMLQYRGRESDHFARQLRRQNVSTIFTTRKLRSCLPSLKSKVVKSLTSRVVYRIQCPGCNSCYVGQTARHLTTRLTEHKRQTSPLGAHFSDCKVHPKSVNAEILDSCLDTNKLLTPEALYIARLKPGLNQRDEYRSRELTVKM